MRGLISVGIVISIGGSLWWLNQALSISHWQIEGDIKLKMAIEKQLAELQDKSYLQTRPARLHKQWLAAIPDMADVQITRILPNSLHIVARARTPIALWQDNSGHIHLVDIKGSPYRQIRAGESPDLPMLRMSSSQLASATVLLNALSRQKIRDIKALSEIRSSDSSWQVYFNKGERWLIPHQRETMVFKQLAEILSQPHWRTRSWRVDARTTSRWFIRPAKQEGVI